MSNCILAWPNYVDQQPNPATTGVVSFLTPTFSGGSWQALLPLTNLQSEKLYKLARTTGVTLANTQFAVDLKTARPQQVFAIVRHNLSQAAKIRFRVSDDSTFATSVYDSGWLNIFQPYYAPGTLPWGWSPAAWSGGPTAEDLINFRSLVFAHVASQVYTARYLKVEIDDTTNGNGFVQIGRLFVAPGYQPQVNMSWGAQLGWAADTVRETSLGGVDTFDVRNSRRQMILTLENLSDHQGMELLFEMQRSLGVHKQLLFMFDPADTYHRHRRSFLATLDKLDPITFAAFDQLSAPVALREVL